MGLIGTPYVRSVVSLHTVTLLTILNAQWTMSSLLPKGFLNPYLQFLGCLNLLYKSTQTFGYEVLQGQCCKYVALCQLNDQRNTYKPVSQHLRTIHQLLFVIIDFMKFAIPFSIRLAIPTSDTSSDIKQPKWYIEDTSQTVRRIEVITHTSWDMSKHQLELTSSINDTISCY